MRNALTRFRGQPPRLRRPGRIVFVCQGNVCRSVFAEYFYARLDTNVEILSGGVSVTTSSPPPDLAIELARRFDLNLTAHRSKPVQRIQDTPDTLYLVLEPWHARARQLRAPRRQRRVHLLGHWCFPPRASIPDPYGQDEAVYQECFELLAGSLTRFHDSLTVERQGPGSP